MSRPKPAFQPPGPLIRSSQRISVTIPHATLEALVERSSHEGRSVSNLAAYLLEASLQGLPGLPGVGAGRAA